MLLGSAGMSYKRSAYSVAEYFGFALTILERARVVIGWEMDIGEFAEKSSIAEFRGGVSISSTPAWWIGGAMSSALGKDAIAIGSEVLSLLLANASGSESSTMTPSRSH